MSEELSADGDAAWSAAESGPSSPVAREILELDHVYDALSHSRRRYLCYTLQEDNEWSLDELARKVAAYENDVSEGEVTPHKHDQVYVSLNHAHVPKLVADGVVTFDEQTETITAAENAQQVLAALKGMGASLDSTQEAHARSESRSDGWIQVYETTEADLSG